MVGSHLVFIFLFFSFAVGLSSLVLFLLLFLKYRQPVLRYYFLALLFYTCEFLAAAIERYFLNTGPAFADLLPAAVFKYWIYGAAAPFFFLYTARLFQEITGTHMTKAAWAGFWASLTACYGATAFSVAGFLLQAELLIRLSRLVLLSAVVVFHLLLLSYLFVLVLVRRNKIENPIMRTIARTGTLLILVFIPGFIFDSVQYVFFYDPAADWLPFIQVFYLVWNLTGLALLAYYFMKRIELARPRTLPADVAGKFGLTRRETEIIALLQEGKSYKKISEELFVSFKTVATHIRNIYLKTGVNSKDGLLDLLGGHFRIIPGPR